MSLVLLYKTEDNGVRIVLIFYLEWHACFGATGAVFFQDTLAGCQGCQVWPGRQTETEMS